MSWKENKDLFFGKFDHPTSSNNHNQIYLPSYRCSKRTEKKHAHTWNEVLNLGLSRHDMNEESQKKLENPVKYITKYVNFT